MEWAMFVPTLIFYTPRNIWEESNKVFYWKPGPTGDNLIHSDNCGQDSLYDWPHKLDAVNLADYPPAGSGSLEIMFYLCVTCQP